MTEYEIQYTEAMGDETETPLERKIKRMRDAEDRQFQADMDLLDYTLRGEAE